MSIKWLIGLVTAFIILTILSGIMEMGYLGSSETGALHNIIYGIQVVSFHDPLTFVLTAAQGVVSIAKGLFKALIWDYAFFQGYWVILKYAIFFPISIGIIVAFFLAIRGVSSG